MIKKEGHGSAPCKYRVFILATSCLEDVWEESGRSREVQEKKAVTGPTEQIGGKGPGTSRCCKHGRSRQTSARLRLCDVVPPQIGPESYRIKVPGVVTLAEEWGGEAWRIQAKECRFGSKLILFSGSTDGDGCCELVIGYTDRVVRAFRWEDLGDGSEHPTGQLVSLKKWMLEGQVRG